MTHLCTAGYEGMDSETWIALLKSRGVDLVVDVRELPQSRKRGFSKRGLEAALSDAGIEYLHVPKLGTPTKWRRDLNAGLDFTMFAKRYGRLLDEHDEDVRRLYHDITGKHACLVCFEEDPSACHRSLIAERLRDLYPTEVKVDHIRHG